jgi:hypothetical protein
MSARVERESVRWREAQRVRPVQFVPFGIPPAVRFSASSLSVLARDSAMFCPNWDGTPAQLSGTRGHRSPLVKQRGGVP